MQPLNTYLVGGAVRDELLGLAVRDRDYVVVGATPQDMLARGFKPVGRDFPVFLHPDDHCEYALARSERNVAPGYHGFEFNTDPTVTLEEDLSRRDLTINAMARDRDGALIDPYNGAADLRQRVLRHVSPAFVEDPVRVLRVARFAARYAALDFTVHPDTLALMRRMVDNGEVNALVPERVWQELSAALSETRPSRFIEVLRDCAALARLLPEVDALFGVPQTPRWHPEVDTGVHVLMALDQAAGLANEVVFAVLVHDLGKGLTPVDVLPAHHGHEAGGVPLVESVCARLKTPNKHRDLALKVCRWHLHAHRAMELTAGQLAKLFERVDAHRQPVLFEQFILACQADATGRAGDEFSVYPQADFLRAAFQAAGRVDVQGLMAAGHSGPQLGERIRQMRVAAIQSFVNQYGR